MKITLFLSICLSFLGALSLTNNHTLIKGEIKNQFGNPISGVKIQVVGTSEISYSNRKGLFEIKAEIGQSLVLNYGNNIKKEIVIYQNPMKIVLSVPNPLELTELVEEEESLETVKFKEPVHSSIQAKMMPLEIHDASGINAFISHNDYDESENYSKPSENKFINPEVEAFSTFSLDVDRASYSNVRRFLDNGQMPPVEAIRIEEMINYFDYNYQYKKNKHPLSFTTNYTDCPWNEKHRLLHVAVKAKDLETEILPKSNFVFLIDVSGSMESVNKLPLVVSSLKMLLTQMREDDRIAIVTYAGNAGVVLESTPATEKRKILKSLKSLTAGGSTAGVQGINAAYKIAEENFIPDGNNRIILATDGDFNVGPHSAEDLEKLIERKRKSGIFLSILGFGMGNYMDHKMQTLANKGNGNHSYIDNIQEAKKILVSEFTGTLFTVAKDVKVQVEFNPAYVQSYKLVGYENRMLEKQDFNNDKKDAGEVGAGHCVTAIYEIIPKGVNSPYASSIDDLRYQETEKVVGKKNNELAYIKCRYKNPDEDNSQKFTDIVNVQKTDLSSLSDDVKFSISVAEFGMILSESQSIESADLKSCINRANMSKGKDMDGYRSEFIRLAESVLLLDTFVK